MSFAVVTVETEFGDTLELAVALVVVLGPPRAVAEVALVAL